MVLPLQELPGYRDALTLVALGQRKAKAEVRAWTAERGLREGEDYLFVS